MKQRLDDPVVPKVVSKIDKDGKMVTPRLEVMFPFLDEEEQEKLALWK